MKPHQSGINTALVHAGDPDPRIDGAIVPPIFQSSTYESAGESSYGALRYLRLSNSPNHLALQGKLAAIEQGESALVTASGMAAISTAFLSVARSGDHLLVQDNLYGGTHSLITHDLAALGIGYDFVDAERPESWQGLLRPSTRAIYVETMSNPLLRIGDLEAVVAFARANGIVSMIDNTFASPINFRPLEYGFDLSLHSCSKYLNGHSDIVAGAAIGGSAIIGRMKERLDHLGGALDAHAAFLLHRGMKTLALRVLRQNDNAQKLAEFLEQHPRVQRVNYPGLASHPAHMRARRLFTGCGGLLSFEIGASVAAAKRMLGALRIPAVAPSLGGVESLITRPAATSHLGVPAAERRRMGIGDTLIRVAVGIEDIDDLIADFTQALDA